MGRLEEIQTNSYEMQLKYLEEMKAKVDIAKSELEQSYMSVIDCKSLFQEFKKENIEEIRSYKFSINNEVSSIKNLMKSLLQHASDIGVSDMKDFVAICERLNSLQKDGFFERFNLTGEIINKGHFEETETITHVSFVVENNIDVHGLVNKLIGICDDLKSGKKSLDDMLIAVTGMERCGKVT